MARSKDIKEVLNRFADEIREIVEREANEQFAARFDDLKASILGGAKRAPRISSPRGGGSSSSKGKPAELVPCPITGEPNKARRFSYLSPDHRSPENIKKFRSWHKKTPEEMRKLGVSEAAINALGKSKGGKKAAKK